MKITKDRILSRIEEVLTVSKGAITSHRDRNYNITVLEKSIFGTISILKVTYGDQSEQIKSLIFLRDKYIKSGDAFRYEAASDIQFLIDAILSTLKSDIEFGFLTSIQNQVAGEIYGDFTSLAKMCVDEGHKEPAAVLACGALEDSMKKFAIKNGLEVYDQ
ncbi:MAG: hypothetical protein H0U39_04285, partial [Segetibacter sp.]|nr:hypothetical protein [Segetibacter sp.]